MVESFRETLHRISSFSWASVALALSLLILEPATDSIPVLGLAVSGSRIMVVGPLALIGLGILRQCLIRNAVYLIERSQEKVALSEVILTYPLLESMRWKIRDGLEVFLLTIFQILIDVLPAVSLIVLWSALAKDGISVSFVHRISTFVVLALGMWNYRSLRMGVYEPLAGPIRTPD